MQENNIAATYSINRFGMVIVSMLLHYLPRSQPLSTAFVPGSQQASRTPESSSTPATHASRSGANAASL